MYKFKRLIAQGNEMNTVFRTRFIEQPDEHDRNSECFFCLNFQANGKVIRSVSLNLENPEKTIQISDVQKS